MLKNKVLFIDNDPGMVGTYATILRARNYDVSTASEGEEGLQKARKDRPDIILLEVNLPDMNGYEVCTSLRSERFTKEIPILMMSDSGQSESVMKARSCGAADYIVKPFNLITLLNKIKKFLVR